MKDDQIYELMKYLPQEYLDEDLQFHVQQAAQPKAEKQSLRARLTAMLRRLRKQQTPQNEIDRILQTPLPAEKPLHSGQNSLTADWTQENDMETQKTTKRLTKSAWVLIAAMALAVGGAAAAIGYSIHKHKADNNLESEISENETPPDTDNAVIFPKLTNQQDSPEMHSFAQTDSGFFYLDALESRSLHQGIFDIYSTTAEDQEQLRKAMAFGPMGYSSELGALKYYDAESGESVFVCAKPNCLHDGSEFCTATTQNYYPISEPVVLNDAVYLVALDYREYQQNPENCTKFPTVLLRYTQDGTEVSEVTRLYLSEKPYRCYADLIAHRGQLWINCVYAEYHETLDDNMMISGDDYFGKWEMYCYEPEPNKLTTLSTSGEAEKNYNPAEGKTCTLDPIGRGLRGVGDYVYFHKSRQDWRDPIKGSGVFRIDCRTGLIEQVVNIKSEKCNLCTVSGDYVFYLYDENRGAGIDYYKNIALRCCNMKTGETTDCPNILTIAQESNSWLTDDILNDKDLMDNFKVEIEVSSLLSSNEHLYAFWQIFDRREWDSTGYMYVSEFDSSGKLLRTADLNNIKNLGFTDEEVRSRVMKKGFGYDKKRWVAPGEATQEDLNFLRYSGCWETEDGDWIHPDSLSADDIEHYEETGYYVVDFVYIQPEDITEEDIQLALTINDRGGSLKTDTLNLYDAFGYGSFNTGFDGKYFYLVGNRALYRITPESLFSDMNAERLLILQ